VDDDVCALEEWGGVERGEECVVYYDERVGGMGVGDLGYEGDIDEPQCWVGGGFYPYCLWYSIRTDDFFLYI
jgi:hypothetical protein